MKQQKRKLGIIFSIGIISFGIVSCRNDADTKNRFPQEKNIMLNNMNIGEKIGGVISMKSVDNHLVLVERNVETQLHLIDKMTKADYMFGLTGEGPGRLLQASNIISTGNRHIGVYDVQKRSLFNFNTDSIIRLNSLCQPEVLIKEVPSFPMAVDRMDEHTYVALGLMSGMKRFTLLNKDGEIVSMEGELPKKKNEQVSDFTHAFAYWGRLTTNPSEHKIAIGTNYAGIIQIYDCKTDTVQLIKEDNLFFADYGERDGNLAITPNTKWGYLSIDSNSKYIFALYSGLNQLANPDQAFLRSNIVHVFDWEGNRICKLLLNRKLAMICVDNSNLYGYDTEQEDIVIADIENI
jgi:hypothetical protein